MFCHLILRIMRILMVRILSCIFVFQMNVGRVIYQVFSRASNCWKGLHVFIKFAVIMHLLLIYSFLRYKSQEICFLFVQLRLDNGYFWRAAVFLFTRWWSLSTAHAAFIFVLRAWIDIFNNDYAVLRWCSWMLRAPLRVFLVMPVEYAEHLLFSFIYVNFGFSLIQNHLINAWRPRLY